MTEGLTNIKINLIRLLVYNFDVWVGDQVGQEAILGIDSMVPADIHLGLVPCLPDEVKIILMGRKPPYRSIDYAGDHVSRPARYITRRWINGSKDRGYPPKAKLWIRRDPKWLPTITTGPGQIKYTND